jgi:hypothetical protein
MLAEISLSRMHTDSRFISDSGLSDASAEGTSGNVVVFDARERKLRLNVPPGTLRNYYICKVNIKSLF